MVGAAGVVAGTLAGILSEEDATGIDDLLCQLHVVFGLKDKMFGSVGVGQVDGLVEVTDQYECRVLQRFLCNLLAWQEVQLAADSFLDVVDDLLRCGDEEHLRVDAVFGL